MIRLIIIVIAILVFFLLTIPFFGITWIIGRFSPEKQSAAELAFLRGFCRLLLFHQPEEGDDAVPADHE